MTIDVGARNNSRRPPPLYLAAGALILLGLPACSTDTFSLYPSDQGVSTQTDAGKCRDADNDGIPDDYEGRDKQIDTDRDGTPDYLDQDSDGDGIPDRVEALSLQTCGKPSDYDSDGIPNFRDLDSDGNGIPDKKEGASDPDKDHIPDFADDDNDGDYILDKIEIGSDPKNPIDWDKDGVPDFLDSDSDNDGIADKSERGNAYPPPLDSDKDGSYDFLDPDSDNDGLSDGDEVNKYKTDPRKADTDGDGVSDLIETLDPKYDPRDPTKNPKKAGDFVFVVEYDKDPVPRQDTLDFATDISQADVFLVVDTTGSMSGEISNLVNSMNTIFSAVAKVIPSTAFGVARYEDFPTSGYGGASDMPFGLLHRVMTVATGAGATSVANGIKRLPPATGGSDGPESGWEAMYQTATGKGTTAGNARVPAFSPTTAPPTPVPAGESVGAIGGAGFRTGSMPIVIWATDAASHDPGGYSSYSFSGAANSASAIAELKKIGARVIGVFSQGGYAASQATTDLTRTAQATGAEVSPAAFGAAGTRPAGCSATQCCTGLNGAGNPPGSGGMCPLVYAINSAGTGLGQSVVKGIETLVSYAKIDISSVAQDDPSDAVNAIQAFINRIETHNLNSATPRCTGGFQVADVSPPGDGVKDTFRQVQPATPVCFDVFAKKNTTVKPTKVPQLFKATIAVLGDGKANLSQRQVYFLVPPLIKVVEVPK